ncbi:WbuX, N-acetyl sugar amidotransferase [Methylophilaceae bacterium]
MSDIQFCKRCLYTTAHPLGLTLDDEGICSGCRTHEEKDTLDWSERWKMLEDLVKPYRNQDGKNYDCIIPVTGAQDSYYIVYLVKERLGLNPLLVTYNKYFNTPLGIRNLANLRIRFNCDIIYQNVNPVSVKKITRSTLRQFGSIYWPILAGQTVFPVQTAVRYKIPLIIWGAHQGLEQVGMFSHEHEVEMTRRYRKDHDLMGYEADDLLSIFDTLKEEDIWQYRYPDDSDLNAIGVRGIYLGNYVRWDPKAQHEQMISEYGYRTSKFSRTFDAYDYVDCFNYMNLHDQLKLCKQGFSKVTDHASREIRHGRLTREEGLALVRKHEQAQSEYSQLFLDWLGVTSRSMQFLLDQYRNPLYWTQTEFGKWQFNGLSVRQDGNVLDSLSGNTSLISFDANDKLESGNAEKYITIGKGWS